MGRTLYEKVYDAHVVNELSGELPLLYIDRHLLHEVTSPQAFSGLREAGRKLRRPDLMLATMDHDISTQKATLDVCSPMAREQVTTLIRNCREFGVTLFGLGHPGQGIVHGHYARVRRQPHGHARRLRGTRVRHRHVRGRARDGDPDPQAAALQDDAHRL